MIEMVVAKSGEPTEIHALRGHPLLISTTIEAAKQWRFRPYRLNGEVVEWNMKVKVIFLWKPGRRCRVELPAAAVKIHQTKRRIL